MATLAPDFKNIADSLLKQIEDFDHEVEMIEKDMAKEFDSIYSTHKTTEGKPGDAGEKGFKTTGTGETGMMQKGVDA